MAAISGLIGMILPYVIIAVLVYMAYRWFVGRAKAAGKAVVKGAKVAGKAVVKGGKVAGKAVVKGGKVAGKAAVKGGKKLSNADDNLLKTKKGKVVYGATMLIPGVAQARLGKAVYRKVKSNKAAKAAKRAQAKA